MKLVTSALFCIFLLADFFVSKSYSQLNIELVSHLPYTLQLSNIWGYEQGGNQYALVGTYNGLSIVDITTPTSPFEVFSISANTSIWREIKTWQHYAYVATEGGGGVMIVDLQNLPFYVNHYDWQDIDGSINRVHALHIDEFGYLYLYGADISNRGCRIYDLNADPMHPAYLGQFQDSYVHDGEVRNNTLYAGLIIDGEMAIIDMTNRANPVLKGSTSTPNNKTHNTWLSNNDSICFTTDETTAAYVTAFNISDPSNIIELDRWQSPEGSRSTPHNVIVRNDYLIVSYYKEGVYVVDAHRPENLVTVGHYDTSPLAASPGFAGCWGAYPLFSNNLIIASDMQEGLFLLQPTYQRASYLEGAVHDSLGNAIVGAECSLINDDNDTVDVNFTTVEGNYKLGCVANGRYKLDVKTTTCGMQMLDSIDLQTSLIAEVNVTLPCGTPVDLMDNTPTQTVYPIPATTFFYINLEDAISTSKRVVITNAQGKKIYEILTSDSSIFINSETWDCGVYFITTSINHKIKTKKIVIIK